MTKWILFPALFALISASVFALHHRQESRIVSLAGNHTLILYDASSGDIPSPTLMRFTDFPPGTASLTFTDGVTLLDTTVPGNDTYAGWISNPTTTAGFPDLDPAIGVQVNFTMQVLSELHANNHRAGFSMILLDRDAKGIELSFWEDQVWVQSDDHTGGLFQHGEGAAFLTTGMITYQLTFAGDGYTLTANSEPLLSGSLRDYRAFDGFPDPYETPNLLFIGDDTTSSQARVKLQFLSVTGTEPIALTATPTSMSTGSPPPTVSATPIVNLTSTPTSKGIELCPSGWLLGMIPLATLLTVRATRRRHTNYL